MPMPASSRSTWLKSANKWPMALMPSWCLMAPGITSRKTWSAHQHHCVATASILTRAQPRQNIWQYLRQNKLAITVYDDYGHILHASCQAWNFFAEDLAPIASITKRDWATLNV